MSSHSDTDEATRKRSQAWPVAAGCLLVLLALALGVGQGGPSAPPAARAAEEPFAPPPIKHVWVINLENKSYDAFNGAGGSFGTKGENSPVPYLANDLTSQGVLLSQYFAIGHESLDNYIAQISGQAPSSDSQGDCGKFSDVDDQGTAPFGQQIGQGCIYPDKVKTIADQLDDRGLSWKGYMEDMGADSVKDGGTRCAHPRIDAGASVNSNFDEYVEKHNPFVYFRSIIGPGEGHAPRCLARDVSLTEMAPDLERVSTTPNLSYITPNNINNAHDRVALDWSDQWLRQYVPLILASPAYRQDGMVIVTFDETDGFATNPSEDTACCNEIPGPNSPMPGIAGPGGGRVGAVILSPFVKPGSVTDHPYNHYSLLRSLEDLYGIKTGGDDGAGHLGYAGTYDDAPGYAGPGSFGPDVYTANHHAPTYDASTPPGGAHPADGSTSWESPAPQGNDLKGISCADASHCTAVGDGGAIASTSDGATWTARAYPGSPRLNAVSCPTTDTCFAAGAGGLVARTTDGGGSWTKTPTGASERLNGLSCSTVDICVAVGDAGTILQTRDGGSTWASRKSGATSRLNTVTCPSGGASGSCRAVGDGGVIVASGDGGATWGADPSPYASNFRSISCTNATTCLIVSDHDRVATTTNGGGSWQLTQNYGGTQRGGFPLPAAVACAPGGPCLMVGQATFAFGVFGDRPPGSFQALSAAGALLGGPDAYDAHTDTRKMDALSAVSCPTATRCFAAGDNGAVVRFSNLPASASAPLPDWSNQRVGPTRQLGGVSCPSSGTCFAVGDGLVACPLYTCSETLPAAGRRGPSTVLARGSDGSWDMQVPSTNRPLDAVSCSSAASCVAVGDAGAIVRTSNGRDWSASGDPAHQRVGSTLLGVSCPAATSHCVAVGDHGRVFTSGDSGNTWSKGGAAGDEFLNGVSCATASDCVAVGGFGTVMRSSDGGASWSSAQSGTSLPLTGVSCPSRTHCYAVGAGGTAASSQDGGVTWAASQTLVPGEDLTAVSCATESSCVAAGSNGTVIATHSGGQTWQVQGTGTDRLLTAVSCPAAQTCYEAGDRGAILRTTPSARARTALATGGGGATGGAPETSRAVSGCQRAPVSSIRRGSIRLTARRIAFSGTSRSPACAGTTSAIKRVEVAVALKAKRSRCRFLTAAGRLSRARSCRRPVFRRVSLRRRGAVATWSFAARASLPHGAYLLILRTTDTRGLTQQVSSRATGGRRA